jgi:hypothetical protein
MKPPDSPLLGRYGSHAGKDSFEEDDFSLLSKQDFFVGIDTTTHAEWLPFAQTKQTIPKPNPVDASSPAIE